MEIKSYTYIRYYTYIQPLENSGGDDTEKTKALN